MVGLNIYIVMLVACWLDSYSIYGSSNRIAVNSGGIFEVGLNFVMHVCIGAIGARREVEGRSDD